MRAITPMKKYLSKSRKEATNHEDVTGRVVSPGCASAEAVVSHGGLNTLASFQKALQFGDKKATCGDQNNTDLYGKEMQVKHFVCRRLLVLQRAV